MPLLLLVAYQVELSLVGSSPRAALHLQDNNGHLALVTCNLQLATCNLQRRWAFLFLQILFTILLLLSAASL